MPLTRYQRAQASVISAIGYPLMSGLGRTLHWTIDGGDHFDAIVRSGRQPILALWHGRIFAATLFWQRRGIIAITSENFDGEWIARIMRRFGYGSARGSTSRGGVKALVRLTREMAAGRPAAFTVDGPRGPARVAQAGAVWLAGATGNPLLPFHIESDRHWTMSSWDGTQIPRPFSHVAIAIGVPIDVPGTDGATMEHKRNELEAALSGLEAAAARLLAEPPAGRDGAKDDGNRSWRS